MDYKTLLEKYWAGETSLAEEQQLRDAQARGRLDIDDPTQELWFEYVARAREQHTTARVVQLPRRRPARLRRLVAVAAAVLLLMVGTTFYLDYQPTEPTTAHYYQDTYQDPEAAYAAIKAALLTTSTKLNEGTALAGQHLHHMALPAEVIDN